MIEGNEKIAIITDSCADIPKEIQEKYSIFVLPIMITCSDGEYRDGVDIQVEQVYEKLKTDLPKTSTPLGEDIEDLLEKLYAEGYQKAIAIMLSGGLSSTVNHMRLSAEDSKLEVYVIDSLSASIGCGAIVQQAALYLEEGCSFEELCEKTERLCKTTEVFFSIDTLEYLQKGGRIGKATAFVGTALNIKPILSFDEDGEIFTPAKVRGHKLVGKKLLSLVDEQKAILGNDKKYNLIVADGAAPEERAELQKNIVEMFPDYENLFEAKIGAALSAYVGPGLLGAGIQILD